MPRILADETIRPGTGASFIIRRSQHIRIIDVEGAQVADLTACALSETDERLSPAVTIDCTGSISVGKGSVLYSTSYRPMLTVVEDTVGTHDLLYPACSVPMYRALYSIESPHANCHDNLEKALAEHGVAPVPLTRPFNIFMNVHIGAHGTVTVDEPLSKPGDYITLRAESDLVVAVAACAVQESRCNGRNPTPVRVQILNGI